ncbi:MAG: hypothetical protein AAGH40_01825 [Verrucomicrobiota bacterium]
MGKADISKSYKYGEAIEDLVAEATSHYFFEDFVFKSPAYYKKNLKKEAADLLVVSGSILIVIQIKTRLIKKENTLVSEIDLGRFDKALEKNQRQFRAMYEWIESSDSKIEAKNILNETVEFDPKSFSDVHLVSIYDFGVLPPENEPQTIKYRPYAGPMEGGLGILNLHIQDYLTILKFCDNLSDFNAWAKVSLALFELNAVDTKSEPLEIWVTLTFYKEKVFRALDSNTRISVNDASENLLEKEKDKLIELDHIEKDSFIIDDLIRLLSGRQSGDISHGTSGKMPKDCKSEPTQVNERKMIQALASLNRNQRVDLIALLKRKQREATCKEVSYGIAHWQDQCPPILVIVSRVTETEMEETIKVLGLSAAHHTNSKSIISIGLHTDLEIRDIEKIKCCRLEVVTDFDSRISEAAKQVFEPFSI